jgi:cell division topological specificity factor
MWWSKKGNTGGSAMAAKERLSIIISRKNIDFIDDLKKDILEVVNKYVNIDMRDIECNLQKNDDGEEILEMNVSLSEDDSMSFDTRR